MLHPGALLSATFSDLMTAGIKSGLGGARGPRAWHWMFVIEDAISIFIAVCAYFALCVPGSLNVDLDEPAKTYLSCSLKLS